MEILIIGLGLGLAAGFSPGPLLTLVLTATLQRGAAAGMRVAVTPLLTDLPIVMSAIWLASSIPAWTLNGLSLLGGLFVVFLGAYTWRDARDARLDVSESAERSAAKDLLTGALVNVLSPHPWLFWAGIGAPRVVELQRGAGLKWAAAFLFLFYLGLIGSKVLLALGVAGGRQALTDVWYRRILLACGALLIGLGLWLGFDGAQGLFADFSTTT